MNNLDHVDAQIEFNTNTSSYVYYMSNSFQTKKYQTLNNFDSKQISNLNDSEL